MNPNATFINPNTTFTIFNIKCGVIPLHFLFITKMPLFITKSVIPHARVKLEEENDLRVNQIFLIHVPGQKMTRKTGQRE